MGIFDGLIIRKERFVAIKLQLNARLQPIHRFDLENMIEEVLEEYHVGEIVGGGSFLMPTGEISSCHIDFEIKAYKVDEFISFLHQIEEIPKGSFVSVNGEKVEIGYAEGMALYLNGTDLDVEVYQKWDINELIESLNAALDGTIVQSSYWDDNDVTAIYFYGRSYVEMKNIILPITKKHPLCKKSTIEQIA